MPGGQGLRHRTRDLFQRGFRQKGFIPLSTYLRVYKVGDYVDIKMNAAVQKVGCAASYGLKTRFETLRCTGTACCRAVRSASTVIAPSLHAPSRAAAACCSRCPAVASGAAPCV
jgi:hypothetical protein